MLIDFYGLAGLVTCGHDKKFSDLCFSVVSCIYPQCYREDIIEYCRGNTMICVERHQQYCGDAQYCGGIS